MRRLFKVWNRGYKIQCFIAVDANEALELAMQSKHIQRISNYKKLLDCTDEELQASANPGLLTAALGAGVSGLAVEGESGWTIGGKELPS